MIAEIQCLPSPAGTRQSAYAHIEAAIAAVVSSDLTYEVGPLGTSVEGAPDEVWVVLRAAHEATLASGAGSTVTVIKVFSDGTQAGPSMADLVAGYR